MAERKRLVDSDAWFKELENRLGALATRLANASALVARSEHAKQEIDFDLSAVSEIVARIEDRVMKVGGGALALDPDAPAVVYLDLPEYPGYRVGSDGSVWGSRSAGRGYGRMREWRQLKPYLVRPGPSLTVSLYRDRERHAVRVDALVMQAFAGPCPDGCEVMHRNGNRLDNRRENLRYE